ncbi:unnamed protein product, partial [Laminaria digitata]
GGEGRVGGAGGDDRRGLRLRFRRRDVVRGGTRAGGKGRRDGVPSTSDQLRRVCDRQALGSGGEPDQVRGKEVTAGRERDKKTLSAGHAIAQTRAWATWAWLG